MNFLVMPIFFLSGALFPLDGLPKALAYATAADPLTYGIDGMRSVLLARPHFGSVTDLVVLGIVGSALLVIGAHRFSRIEI